MKIERFFFSRYSKIEVDVNILLIRVNIYLVTANYTFWQVFISPSLSSGFSLASLRRSFSFIL